MLATISLAVAAALVPPAIRKTPAPASIAIACGGSFDDRLRWLLSLCDKSSSSPLFRVEEIGPADSPRYARVAGNGLSLWLNRELPEIPLTLRLTNGVESTPAPPGCEAIVIGEDPLDAHPREQPLPLRMPPTGSPTFTVNSGDGGWGTGRAGMLYRDLLPDRAGGALIASHIRIPTGGPVPDYTHFHRITFQLIYVLRGWVEVVYEGQGPPFRMGPGDFVTQPPTIRHQVLSCSDGLEVLEIGLPAEHATIADHSFELPDESTLKSAKFGGQVFVRHIAEEHETEAVVEHGVAWRETAVAESTGGLASVRIGQMLDTAAATAAPLVSRDDAIALGFVLDGAATLEVEEEGQQFELSQDSFVSTPPGVRCRFAAASDDLRLLDIRVREAYKRAH